MYVSCPTCETWRLKIDLQYSQDTKNVEALRSKVLQQDEAAEILKSMYADESRRLAIAERKIQELKNSSEKNASSKAHLRGELQSARDDQDKLSSRLQDLEEQNMDLKLELDIVASKLSRREGVLSISGGYFAVCSFTDASLWLALILVNAFTADSTSGCKQLLALFFQDYQDQATVCDYNYNDHPNSYFTLKLVKSLVLFNH